MQDKEKKTKGSHFKKNEDEERNQSLSAPLKNIPGRPPGNWVSTSEEGDSLNKIGDSIYQVFCKHLSAVTNEIIAEIELSDND